MSKAQKTKNAIRKGSVGLLGGLVVILGLILVPYPGPGWLIVFAGLAILGTEFDRAQQILDVAKKKYDDWQSWIKSQKHSIQIVFWLLTGLVVVVTVWLLNGYGFINDFLRLGLDWVDSPLPIFNK